MITARANAMGAPEMWVDADPKIRVRGLFPLHGGMGTTDTSMVYFELEPGNELGRHTDSAEEILLILDGSVEAMIGDETGMLTEGDMAVVPEMVPHNVRNVGETTARVMGFFPKPHMVATFEQPFMPMGRQVIETA